jgi:hypothetical protein
LLKVRKWLSQSVHRSAGCQPAGAAGCQPARRRTTAAARAAAAPVGKLPALRRSGAPRDCDHACVRGGTNRRRLARITVVRNLSRRYGADD